MGSIQLSNSLYTLVSLTVAILVHTKHSQTHQICIRLTPPPPHPHTHTHTHTHTLQVIYENTTCGDLYQYLLFTISYHIFSVSIFITLHRQRKIMGQIINPLIYHLHRCKEYSQKTYIMPCLTGKHGLLIKSMAENNGHTETLFDTIKLSSYILQIVKK